MQTGLWKALIVSGTMLRGTPGWSVPPTVASCDSKNRVIPSPVCTGKSTSHLAQQAAEGESGELPHRESGEPPLSTPDPIPQEQPASPALDRESGSESPPLNAPEAPSSEPLSPQDPAPPSDPDLGDLQLRDPDDPPDNQNGDGESPPFTPPPPGSKPPQTSGVDRDLGILILEPKVPAPVLTRRPKAPPIVYLQGRVDYVRSSNALSGIDPIDDSLLRTGISLLATPSLGRKTFLILRAELNQVQYADQEQVNFDELRFRAGVLRQLSPRMFGEIGWTNQQLYTGDENLVSLLEGRSFLNDHAIRLELSRVDPLTKKLSLTTFYQLRLSFADPESRNRVINSLFVSLGYEVIPGLQAALDYQFALSDFTQQDREDEFHQVVLRFTYRLSQATRVNAFGGFSFGRSDLPSLDFDGAVFGVSVSVNLPLF